MFKTPHLHCRGRGFCLWEGMKIPHAAGHSQKKRDNNKVGCVKFPNRFWSQTIHAMAHTSVQVKQLNLPFSVSNIKNTWHPL